VPETAFVPPGFDPPTTLSSGDLHLEPLGPQHNERDHAAWSSSIEHIRNTPGYPDGRWPREMSPEENLADLERHARDFADRKGFTFTVLDATDDVIGCVYIYPVNDGVHDVVVQSWVRESVAALDEPLRRAVADWVVSDAWPFERPLYEPLLT
jgi:RimJ/RimL family protein N-acetyltransferase